ncbi:MAG: hypothetical protein IT436_03925 [Phycisphaerales bacterium]|nr:hypothetical protein [Phycisphaerales bacterium]
MKIRHTATALTAGLLATGPLATARADTLLYQEDFETARLSSNWSTNSRISSDSAFSYFNGRYSGQYSTLTLTAPPPPEGSGEPGSSFNEFTLSFDLYIIDSWDGDDPNAGIDRFLVELNGASIFDQTFANQHEYQSYRRPDVGPTYLGFNSAFKDSIYRNVSVTFAPGSLNPLALTFRDTCRQGMSDESWGLDNIRLTYRTVPAPGSLALASLAGLLARRRRA